MFAPAKTPKPVIDKLTAEIAKVMATPAFKQKAAEQGAAADYMSPQQLADYSQVRAGALGAGGQGVEDRGRLRRIARSAGCGKGDVGVASTGRLMFSLFAGPF